MNNPFGVSCSPDRTPLTFGKFKGNTPEEIAEIEPSYVVWMYDNVDKKLCSKALYLACENQDDE